MIQAATWTDRRQGPSIRSCPPTRRRGPARPRSNRGREHAARFRARQRNAIIESYQTVRAAAPEGHHARAVSTAPVRWKARPSPAGDVEPHDELGDYASRRTPSRAVGPRRWPCRRSRFRSERSPPRSSMPCEPFRREQLVLSRTSGLPLPSRRP
jgi:hypothetical protein